MAIEVSYIIITPYSLLKSRTGGIIARLMSRTDLEFIGAQVLAFTGDVIGGVCPFAIEHPNVTTYLDVSLQRFDIVYPAAGSANSAVKLSLPELEACSGSAGWIDVCKGWQAGG